jgi:hypothetical protein
MRANGFAEVVVDPKTGAIAKAERITDAEDLEAVATQKAAMEQSHDFSGRRDPEGGHSQRRIPSCQRHTGDEQGASGRGHHIAAG